MYVSICVYIMSYDGINIDFIVDFGKAESSAKAPAEMLWTFVVRHTLPRVLFSVVFQLIKTI